MMPVRATFITARSPDSRVSGSRRAVRRTGFFRRSRRFLGYRRRVFRIAGPLQGHRSGVGLNGRSTRSCCKARARGRIAIIRMTRALRRSSGGVSANLKRGAAGVRTGAAGPSTNSVILGCARPRERRGARIGDPLAAKVVDLGNAIYGLTMRGVFAQIFAPAPLPRELRVGLSVASGTYCSNVPDAHRGRSRDAACRLIPSRPEVPRGAGLTFSLPHSAGQLVQRCAAQIFGERAKELACAAEGSRAERGAVCPWGLCGPVACASWSALQASARLSF